MSMTVKGGVKMGGGVGLHGRGDGQKRKRRKGARMLSCRSGMIQVVEEKERRERIRV
jgi:hypothetical protein